MDIVPQKTLNALPSSLVKLRGTLHTQFLRRGGLIALSSFSTGLRTVIAVTVVASGFGAQAVTAYGVAASIYGVGLVLCAGYTILVANRLAMSKKRNAPDDQLAEPLGDIFRLVVASTILLCVVVPALGVVAVFVLPLSTSLFVAAYATLSISFVSLPFSQSMMGVQQIRGQEFLNLRNSLENLGLFIALTALDRLLIGDAVVALVVLGVGGALIDFWSVRRRYVRLGVFRPLVKEQLLRGLKLFQEHPLSSLLSAPKATTGALDGVVLASTFMLVAQVSTVAGPFVSSLTVVGITTLRTIIVPLKGFGTVGGRLTKVESATLHEQPTHFRNIVLTMYAFAIPVGAIFLFVPTGIMWVLQLPVAPESFFLVRMMGVQILLEPVTGVASSMLKIVRKPGAVLLPLIFTMWGLVIPISLILVWTSALTIQSIWFTLLGARVLFFVIVVATVVVWARHAKEPLTQPAPA